MKEKLQSRQGRQKRPLFAPVLFRFRFRDSRTAAQQIASALRKFGQFLRSLAQLGNREHLRSSGVRWSIISFSSAVLISP
jgi:hypothetical protein